MITIDKVTAGYDHKVVLNELSLVLEEGAIHGLVGLNGSGKSTLFKCICTLHPIQSGTILRNNTRIKQGEISLLSTDPYFYHGITGEEYLSLFNANQSGKFDLDEWQKLFNIPLKHLIDGYSTGMRKQLAILGLLKANKQIMLFDEPFNGLDIEAARVFSTILKKLASNGKTILVSSHILETLTSISDKIHYLKNGKIFKTFDAANLNSIDAEIFNELDADIALRIENLFNFGNQ